MEFENKLFVPVSQHPGTGLAVCVSSTLDHYFNNR